MSGRVCTFPIEIVQCTDLLPGFATETWSEYGLNADDDDNCIEFDCRVRRCRNHHNSTSGTWYAAPGGIGGEFIAMFLDLLEQSNIDSLDGVMYDIPRVDTLLQLGRGIMIDEFYDYFPYLRMHPFQNLRGRKYAPRNLQNDSKTGNPCAGKCKSDELVFVRQPSTGCCDHIPYRPFIGGMSPISATCNHALYNHMAT